VCVVGGAIVGPAAVAAYVGKTVAVPAALSYIGLSSTGPVAGGWFAAQQVAGAVTAGSKLAFLHSVAMGGQATAVNAAFGSVGGAVGGAVAYATGKTKTVTGAATEAVGGAVAYATGKTKHVNGAATSRAVGEAVSSATGKTMSVTGAATEAVGGAVAYAAGKTKNVTGSAFAFATSKTVKATASVGRATIDLVAKLSVGINTRGFSFNYSLFGAVSE